MSTNRPGDQTQTAAELQLEWDANPRWDGVRRDYTADDVIALRGPVREERTLAQRGAERLWDDIQQNTGTAFAPQEDPQWSAALGALTGNQAVQQVRAGLKAIYLSAAGRSPPTRTSAARPTPTSRSTRRTRCRPSCAASTTRCCAPARSSRATGAAGSRDWMAPIVADAEAGFGGPLNAYELMHQMIEAGAAGVHWEDQLASEKKCGHMGGKVLIPTSQHIRTHQRGAARGGCRRRADRSSSPAPTRSPRPCSRATTTSATSRSSRASAPPRASTRCRTASSRSSPAASPTPSTPTCSGSSRPSPTSTSHAASPRPCTRSSRASG